MASGIGDVYRRDDCNIYHWVISGIPPEFVGPGSGVLRVTHYIGPPFGVGLVIPTLAYFWTWLVFYLFTTVVAILVKRLGGDPLPLARVTHLWCGVLMMTLVLALIGYCYWIVWTGTGRKRLQIHSNLTELLTSSVGVLAFLMSQPFSSGFSGTVASIGFKGTVASIWQWLLFFLDNASRVVFLDTPEIVEMHLSDIQPHTWYARSATVFFKFLVGVGTVEFLLSIYRKRFRRVTFDSTVEHAFFKCENMLDRDTLRLKREGRIEPIQEGFVKMVDFINALGQNKPLINEIDQNEPESGTVGVPHIAIRAFEHVVLLPLKILVLSAGVFFVFKKTWVFAVFLLLISLLLHLVGRSLPHRKSQYTRFRDMTEEDKATLTKVNMLAGFLVSAVAAAAAFHRALPWRWALAYFAGTFVLFPVVSTPASLAWSWFMMKTYRRHP